MAFSEGPLRGRVAVITGAGRGIGREHALAFARASASVVVNDLGGAGDGTRASAAPAEEVAGLTGRAAGRPWPMATTCRSRSSKDIP
jgi:NAD(P)-dependent dehydrogenase (short-subunit alcohol dehydrogenase family)